MVFSIHITNTVFTITITIALPFTRWSQSWRALQYHPQFKVIIGHFFFLPQQSFEPRSLDAVRWQRRVHQIVSPFNKTHNYSKTGPNQSVSLLILNIY